MSENSYCHVLGVRLFSLKNSKSFLRKQMSKNTTMAHKIMLLRLDTDNKNTGYISLCTFPSALKI